MGQPTPVRAGDSRGECAATLTSNTSIINPATPSRSSYVTLIKEDWSFIQKLLLITLRHSPSEKPRALIGAAISRVRAVSTQLATGAACRSDLGSCFAGRLRICAGRLRRALGPAKSCGEDF